MMRNWAIIYYKALSKNVGFAILTILLCRENTTKHIYKLVGSRARTVGSFKTKIIINWRKKQLINVLPAALSNTNLYETYAKLFEYCILVFGFTVFLSTSTIC